MESSPSAKGRRHVKQTRGCWTRLHLWPPLLTDKFSEFGLLNQKPMVPIVNLLAL